MNPRKPTDEEKEQLIQYLWMSNYVNPKEEDIAQQREFVDRTAIAVFDHYTTDSPGYSGKVMLVVWSGSPGLTQTFIWNREEIELCPNEM